MKEFYGTLRITNPKTLTNLNKKIMKNYRNYRQGDVYILSKKKVDGDFKKIKSMVLAEGEVTGHSHVLKPHSNDCKIEVLENPDGCYIRIKGTAIVEHQEHEKILIPSGDYEVRIQREYCPVDYARRVAD